MTDTDTKIAFLLSVTEDDDRTIQRLDADLKESREYALALEKELRDRLNSACAWVPPENRPVGFECLAQNSYGIWRHVRWTGAWQVRGTFADIDNPTAFAPLPEVSP